MQLDFQGSDALITPLKWVKDPDPQTQQGSAERYVLLEQISDEQGLLTSWGMKGSCLQRFVESRGRQGTSFLLDAEHLVSHASSNPAYKDVSLRLRSTQGNSVKVQTISRIVGDTIVGNGHINVPTYPGSLREFPKQSALPHVVATINYSQLKPLTLRANKFSVLITDKCERHVLLRLSANKLECISAEPGGANGFAHCYQVAELEVYNHPEVLQIAMFGRYFTKAAEVGRGTIEIRLDSLENPTMIQLVGERGILTSPLTNQQYQIRYLQNGVYSFLGHPSARVVEIATRGFDCEGMINCLEMQRPLSNATRRDLRLEQAGADIQISKMGDVRRTEYSLISNAPDYTHFLEDKWLPISCNYEYLKAALEVALATIRSQRRGRGAEEGADEDGDEEYIPYTPSGNDLEFYGDDDFGFDDEEGEEQEEQEHGNDSAVSQSSRVLVQLKQIEATRAYILYLKCVATEDIQFSINATAGAVQQGEDEG